MEAWSKHRPRVVGTASCPLCACDLELSLKAEFIISVLVTSVLLWIPGPGSGGWERFKGTSGFEISHSRKDKNHYHYEFKCTQSNKHIHRALCSAIV
jgi:hypothetical protein